MSEKNEWKPIESAPKDGSEFLACYTRQGNVTQIVKWNTLHGHFASKGEWLPGFTANATHWMPLPAAPGSTSSAPGDAQDERQAFEAWAKRKKMPLARIGQQYDDFWVDHARNGWQARAALAAPAAGDARKPDFARAEQIAADFVQDYEWRGEDVAGRDTCYTPNKRERAMITDAILGLLAEPEFVAALAAQVPQQGEA